MYKISIQRKEFSIVSSFLVGLSRNILKDYKYKFHNVTPDLPQALLKFSFMLVKKSKIELPKQTKIYSSSLNPNIIVTLGSVRQDIDAEVMSEVFNWLENVTIEEIEFLLSYLKETNLKASIVYHSLKLLYFELTNPNIS